VVAIVDGCVMCEWLRVRRSELLRKSVNGVNWWEHWRFPPEDDVKGGAVDFADFSAAARERQQCHNTNGAMRAARLLITLGETPHERRIGRHVITRVNLTSSLLSNSRAAASSTVNFNPASRTQNVTAVHRPSNISAHVSTVASSVPASHPYVAGHALLAG
jgi:hypothetical protein